MDHYNNDHGPDHRYKNDLLNEQRKTNVLLEQIVQLLKPQERKESRRPNENNNSKRGRKANK